MKKRLILVFAAFIISGIAATVDAVTQHEILVEEAAAALASVDYAREKCKRLKIDQDVLAALVKRSGNSLNELRKHSYYEKSLSVVKGVENNISPNAACDVLSSLNNGRAKGVFAE